MATICEIKVELKLLGVKGITGKKKAELLDMLAKAKQSKEQPKEIRKKKKATIVPTNEEKTIVPADEEKTIEIRRKKKAIVNATNQVLEEELEYNRRRDEMKRVIPDPPKIPAKYKTYVYQVLHGRPDTTHQYVVYGLGIPYNGYERDIDLRSYIKRHIYYGKMDLEDYFVDVLKWLDTVSRPIKNNEYSKIILYDDYMKLF